MEESVKTWSGRPSFDTSPREEPGLGSPVLELAAELVAIDSQNPGVGEARIAAFVADHARERGLAADLDSPLVVVP